MAKPSSVPEILSEIEGVCGNWYASHAPKPPVDVNDPRATFTHHSLVVLEVFFRFNDIELDIKFSKSTENLT